MADVAVEFGKQFHNLEGNLVGERKKNLFKLLQNKSLFSNKEHLNIALNNLKPKTYLENLLKIDILIYFKKTEKLLEIFKEGNEIFISKIIKQPWFFEEVFKNVSAEKLVNEFLPCTSFITRTKVLKRLSVTLSESQMDEVFECVLKRYGLHVAINILHSCSSTKVIQFMSSNEVYLRPNQIKVLYNKDEKLFKLYLKHYKDTTGYPYDNENLFRYIAVKNPNLLLELNKEDKLYKHLLGRRASKKIVDHIKSEVSQDIKFYTSILKHCVIVRKLGDSFKNVYLDLFPRKIEDIDINNFCNELLKFYPKSRRWSLFALTFAEVFGGQSVTDNLNHLDSYLVDLCPQKEVKQMWAKMKYNSENDDSFLKYFDPSIAIPLIKEKINVTSKIYKRLDLIKLMLDTCAQNKDLHSLEKVLEYFCFRHRNEEVSVRKDILDHIKHRFQFEDLSESHWKCINEQIQILRVNKEYNYYSCSIFNRKYLEFLFKNGKSFREEILQFAKEAISEIVSFLPDIKNPAVEKQIFIQIVNIVPEVVDSENDEDYKRIHRQLILDVISFNEGSVNSDCSLSFLDFPNLITFIDSILDKTENFDYNECMIVEKIIRYNYKFPQNSVNIDNDKLLKMIVANLNQEYFYLLDLIEYIVTRKNRSELEDQTLHLYLNNVYNREPSKAISFWFLKNEPQTIAPYFDKIMATMFFKEIKFYSHFNFDVRFTTFLKNELKNPDGVRKEKIIRYLSVLLPTKDFISIVVEHFLPKKRKLDLQDEEMKEVYNLQCEVAKVLKNVEEPVKMLPIVMKFCIGDYLQSALRSLYSICYRSPENNLYLYMDILSKNVVSVRKHAVFLSCALLNHKYAVLQLRIGKHGNVSSQKHIFSATLKYFLKNPSQELLDMVISNMSKIDKSDTETLDRLSSIDFPNRYRAVYLEKCWEFFESLRNRTELKVDKYLRKLLLTIINSPDILKTMAPVFCKHILNCYFVENSAELINIELFVCNVLRYRETEQLENFHLVFRAISRFKEDSFKTYINVFFEKFFVVATEDMNGNFVKLFTDFWDRLFSPMEMFDQRILLKLLNMQCESGKPFIENYAKRVVELLEQLNSEYGLHIHNKFKNLLKKVVNSTFEQKRDQYLFFYSILKFKTTSTTSMLVLDVMNKLAEDNPKEICDIFNSILHILNKVEEPIVKIYYKYYIS